MMLSIEAVCSKLSTSSLRTVNTWVITLTALSMQCKWWRCNNVVKYRHSPGLRNGYVPEHPANFANFAQGGIQCTCQLYTDILGSRPTVEIQTPTHWNLISRSMIAPPSVLSPTSILPPPLSQCAFIPARKNSAPFSNVILIFFFYFL
jgi:hypothetical protein